ncbi:hypothetical protein BS50DRAFT_588883 [Corynespora cassiicola Philippines]|uniref:Kinetochore protein fta4 n=1 Tax=Corynespora cassiicola Philippines TaxID=1448308 RepID=A0A2T2NL15_CORCC|nr:hypothetical protein BS50DRAFT_588883 [Corynespora cassiicola Philippines]
MSTQGTVVEQKQKFLLLQKQALSRGIPPSERLLTIAHDAGIPSSVLRDVLVKVNRELKQHSRKVYSRQMTEHVVEQIDKLYWDSGSRDFEEEEAETNTDTGEDNNTLYRGDDLSQDDNISKLPMIWDTSTDRPSAADDKEIDQDDYTEAVARLQDLSARRLTLQQKLNTYKTLLELLEPYRNPKENIQPNLVWRDSPLAPELAKTRTLAIRVAGRVEEKFANESFVNEGEEDVIIEEDGKAKLDRILATW